MQKNYRSQQHKYQEQIVTERSHNLPDGHDDMNMSKAIAMGCMCQCTWVHAASVRRHAWCRRACHCECVLAMRAPAVATVFACDFPVSTRPAPDTAKFQDLPTVPQLFISRPLKCKASSHQPDLASAQHRPVGLGRET